MNNDVLGAIRAMMSGLNTCRRRPSLSPSEQRSRRLLLVGVIWCEHLPMVDADGASDCERYHCDRHGGKPRDTRDAALVINTDLQYICQCVQYLMS